MAQADFLNKLIHTDYIANAGINEFECIRKNLRDLIKYIPKVDRNIRPILLMILLVRR